MNNKKKNIKQIPYILIAIFLIIQGCKSNNFLPLQPEPPKDPRTYTWTSDTLSYFGSAQTLMQSLWGSSPKDVYAVGHNDRGDGKMFHFDGVKWSSIDLSTNRGGLIPGAIDLRSIYGFSANNIYAVGQRIYSNHNPPPNFLDSSLILNYNGTAWTEVSLPSAGNFLTSVYGTGSNDVWAGGVNTLYHFDGAEWQRDTVLVSVPANSFFLFTSFAKYNENLYAVGYTNINNGLSENHYLFKEKDNNMSIIDSTINSFRSDWGITIWGSPEGNLYGGDHIITKYNGSSWTNISHSDKPIIAIYGTSDNNIFVSENKVVYHYNGTDWEDITGKLSDNRTSLYGGIWTDGTEVFIIEQPLTGGASKTVIWHGK